MEIVQLVAQVVIQHPHPEATEVDVRVVCPLVQVWPNLKQPAAFFEGPLIVENDFVRDACLDAQRILEFQQEVQLELMALVCERFGSGPASSGFLTFESTSVARRFVSAC